MDWSTRIVLSVALLLAVNNAITRVPVLRDREVLFWTVQLVDLGACIALLVYGIPGFADMPAVSWMLGLLFLLHVAQNLRWRAERRRERGASDDVEAKKSALLKALGEPDEPEEPE
ncbi:MAG: hypothetical protein H6737_26285 [Alphaproteobacteria bacterium]|nr:hypothetical protein [Alphaproteobacteria bacterium]